LNYKVSSPNHPVTPDWNQQYIHFQKAQYPCYALHVPYYEQIISENREEIKKIKTERKEGKGTGKECKRSLTSVLFTTVSKKKKKGQAGREGGFLLV
jgi:hypothetical protein